MERLEIGDARARPADVPRRRRRGRRGVVMVMEVLDLQVTPRPRVAVQRLQAVVRGQRGHHEDGEVTRGTPSDPRHGSRPRPPRPECEFRHSLAPRRSADGKSETTRSGADGHDGGGRGEAAWGRVDSFAPPRSPHDRPDHIADQDASVHAAHRGGLRVHRGARGARRVQEDHRRRRREGQGARQVPLRNLHSRGYEQLHALPFAAGSPHQDGGQPAARGGAAGAGRAPRLRARPAAGAHASRHPVRARGAARPVLRQARGGVARARRHGDGERAHRLHHLGAGQLRRVPDDDDAVARVVRREQVRAGGGAGNARRPGSEG
mmetsp:Transcript_166/g.626  ORF Transcript_166/g.626 Transcript_166/m.626 type:complete len:321 (-) Transcript_166:2554-3516(-)